MLKVPHTALFLTLGALTGVLIGASIVANEHTSKGHGHPWLIVTIFPSILLGVIFLLLVGKANDW
jgi:hypothetical protein